MVIMSVWSLEWLSAFGLGFLVCSLMSLLLWAARREFAKIQSSRKKEPPVFDSKTVREFYQDRTKKGVWKFLEDRIYAAANDGAHQIVFSGNVNSSIDAKTGYILANSNYFTMELLKKGFDVWVVEDNTVLRHVKMIIKWGP